LRHRFRRTRRNLHAQQQRARTEAGLMDPETPAG
jgi:hypothetical protein